MKYEQSNFNIHHELPIPSRILDQVKKLRLSSTAKGSTSGKLTMTMGCKFNTRK
jgi:hypothetical protein